MTNFISISEESTAPLSPLETKLSELPTSSTLVSKQIKITNTSTDYIHDLKLIIHGHELNILAQSVTRLRGSLSFDTNAQCLELGNLAPNESAYFEYQFLSPSNLSSLSSHFSLRYYDPIEETTEEHLLADYLATDETPEDSPSDSPTDSLTNSLADSPIIID